jgi:trans-aconitate methyltransferase
MSHFAGTASFYSEFRPGYPQRLFDTLAAEANLDRSSSVLDLGAGPATLTLGLARKAGSVVAVDLDPQMVEEGLRLTEQEGLENVEWINTSAESFNSSDHCFQLITVASAFHWMDRRLVDQLQESNVQRFLGFLRSTSSRPDQRLGDQFKQFATEIDAAIRAAEPSGQWTLTIPVEVILGR